MKHINSITVRRTKNLLQRNESKVNFIRHLKIEKGTGAEMCRAIVSGIVTGDAHVSCCSK